MGNFIQDYESPTLLTFCFHSNAKYAVALIFPRWSNFRAKTRVQLDIYLVEMIADN